MSISFINVADHSRVEAKRLSQLKDKQYRKKKLFPRFFQRETTTI
jgi:hypothetical protein